MFEMGKGRAVLAVVTLLRVPRFSSFVLWLLTASR